MAEGPGLGRHLLLFSNDFLLKALSLFGQSFKVLNLSIANWKEALLRIFEKVLELLLCHFMSRVHLYKAIHLHPRLGFRTVLSHLGLLSSLVYKKEIG